MGAVVGVATFAGLWLLRVAEIDVPYTLLLALIVGFGELIPVVGPILSAIPAIIVVSGDGVGAMLAVVLVYVVIQQVESQILVPRIVGARYGSIQRCCCSSWWLQPPLVACCW